MRRYWLPASALRGDSVEIEGEPLHHIRDVCRMGMGARFEVLIEGGFAYLVEVVEESKRMSRAKVLESRLIPPLPSPQIHLILSVPRFPVFESTIEKAVELGVASVRPALSDFSFIRSSDDAFEKKRARFEKIVIGATQQTGRGDIMPVRRPERLDSLVSTFNLTAAAAGLFAYEGEGGAPAKEGVARLGSPSEAWIFVGSEGGFSDREVAMFRAAGLQPVTLGPQILRVETACVALVSVLKYGFDQMR